MDSHRVTDAFAKMLGYADGTVQERAQQSIEAAGQKRLERQNANFAKEHQRIQELEKTLEKQETLTATEVVEAAREHRELIARYVSVYQMPQGIDLFDFDPALEQC
jgi:hypothetical protein